jgi:hypothetical protein
MFILKLSSGLIRTQTFDGRDHPHRSQFLYLRHLEDHIVKCRASLEKAKEFVDRWGSEHFLGYDYPEISEWLPKKEELKKDIDYLLEEFRHLTTAKTDLTDMVCL